MQLPLGRWPGTANPRRLLLISDADDTAPERLNLEESTRKPKRSAAAFNASMEPLPCWQEEIFFREEHVLRLRHGNTTLDLLMGLKTGGETHWWEACRLKVLARLHEGVIVEMGGSIAVHRSTTGEMRKFTGLRNPYLHRHNWLSARIYARLHWNGVAEIFAHHINNKFFDAGRDLEEVVPVIGLRAPISENEVPSLLGPWDGSVSSLDLGSVRLDVRELARLATPRQPGTLTWENDILVLQPYMGAELYGGDCPAELTGDPFIFHAEKQLFPCGMARTLRFTASLSGKSPRVVRYLAPASHYKACQEFFPDFGLPQTGDSSLETARQWATDHILEGGFEDGAMPRHLKTGRMAKGRLRHEAGWEGELPYAQFLTAWRTGDPADYSAALRAAYYFTDVAVDHAGKLVRMHGFGPPAVSLPMNRMQGTIAAFLETGDPYLLETAQAVTTTAHWQHRNSWPRMTVGRDGCYVRSAILLYRYFGEDFFRQIALEGALDVAESQRADGSFGDQGGGAGIHQWTGYLTKPWMGLLALNGVLDYLQLFPAEEKLKQSVRKFADWLMRERQDRNGGKTWCYQHDYNSARIYYDFHLARWIELPSQGSSWHHETLARLLGYAAQEFGDAAYREAWLESHRIAATYTNDHAVAAALQFLPSKENFAARKK